jgi:hypothetical protein
MVKAGYPAFPKTTKKEILKRYCNKLFIMLYYRSGQAKDTKNKTKKGEIKNEKN